MKTAICLNTWKVLASIHVQSARDLVYRKSKKFWHWTLGSGGKKTFKCSEQMKKSGVTHATWRLTHDTWHMTPDTWHVKHYTHRVVNIVKKNSDLLLWQLRSNGVMWQMKLDMWHVTWGDMWHVTCDMGQITCYRWHLTCDTWHKEGGEHCLKIWGP